MGCGRGRERCKFYTTPCSSVTKVMVQVAIGFVCAGNVEVAIWYFTVKNTLMRLRSCYTNSNQVGWPQFVVSIPAFWLSTDK